MGGGFGGSGFGGTPKHNHKNKKPRKKKTTSTKPPGETAAAAGAGAGGSVVVSPAVQHLIHTLQTDGVVRIDDVLADETCDAARDYVVALRDRATQELMRPPETPTTTPTTRRRLQRHDRFADVLVNQNRCDLKVPLGPEPVHTVLLELLNDNQQQQEQENTNKGDDTGAGEPLQERSSLV